MLGKHSWLVLVYRFFKAKDLARLALSYLVILAFNILGVVLLHLMNETTTSNQSNINDLVQNSSLISSFMKVLVAGSCGDHESDIRDHCLRFLTIAYLFLLGKR